MKYSILVLSFTFCITVGFNAMSDEKKILIPGNTIDKQELLIQLSSAMGRDIDKNDTEALQAAEAFLVSDAAKAYAFTKVHSVGLEFCPNDQALIEALNRYQESARDIIALGKIYYDSGIDLTIGEKRMKKSSSELNGGLDEMLNGIRKEYEELTDEEVALKCNEASKALTALSQIYGG